MKITVLNNLCAMRKFVSIFSFAAIAAATLVSCSKEIDNPEVIDSGVKMKTITVKTAIKTKTTLDADHENIVWSAGDKISIFNNVDKTNLQKEYVAGGDIIIEVPEATTEIYAHYPYYDGNTNGPESVSVYINNKQTQTNPGKLNGYYYPMVAKGTVSADNKALISLYPVAGALALNIYHTGLSGEESVKSVKVTPSSSNTGNTGFIGRQITDITGDNIQYTLADKSDPITVTLTNPLALGNTKPANKQTFAGQIYVCLAKQSYSEVNFEIETDKATYTITSNSTPFDLKNNDFVPVNINLAKAKSVKEIYSTEFNYAISGTSYTSSSPIIGTDDEATTSWSIVYGNWNKSNCAQMRVYSAGKFGCVYNNFDCSKVTSVSYSARVSNTALKLNTYYSTDSGKTWTQVDNALALTTSAKDYSFVVSETGEYDAVRIKFEVTGTAPESDNYSLTIDDVKIYGYGEVLKDASITLSSSEVVLPYQGTAQTIDVTSNYNWQAEFVQNESYTLTVAPNTGNNTNTAGEVTEVSISATENTANAEITLGTINFYDVATSEVKATCTVKQEARPANGVSVSNATPQLASGSGSSVTVNVTCNWAWEAALTSGSGFSFSPTSGTGNGSITITSTVESGAEGVITLTDKDDNTSTCTIEVSQAAAGTLAAGTILWTDTFGDFGGTGTIFTDQKVLSDYTYKGRSGYDSNATSVTLTASNDDGVRATTSDGTNCISGHLWFNKSTAAEVTTSAISLFGATSLVITYDQGTSSSSIVTSYSIDGSNWTSFGSTGPGANKTHSFTVPSGTTSVMLKFAHPDSNAKNTRFDNPTLKVGE